MSAMAGAVLLVLAVQFLAALAVLIGLDAEQAGAGTREGVPAPAVVEGEETTELEPFDRYVCRASRLPARATVTDTGRAHAVHPWRLALEPGLGWVTSEYNRVRLPVPWPELAARLRREAILTEATGEFRAIVLASLWDMVREQVRA